MEWRKANGKPEGYETMRAKKPIVAVGPEHPLEDEELMADFFREFPAMNSFVSTSSLPRTWLTIRPLMGLCRWS